MRWNIWYQRLHIITLLPIIKRFIVEEELDFPVTAIGTIYHLIPVKRCRGTGMKNWNLLSFLWSILFQNSSDKLSSGKCENEVDNQRIKTMITFLEEHFNEAIGLTQIAASANIGKRECIRCFQRMFGLSPIQYLIKYRISESLHYLSDTDMPISEIALCCGFDSPSYFAHIFKRYQKCTSRQFRIFKLI